MDKERVRQVVRKASRGDRDAAGVLFDHFHPKVYRFALVKLAHPADAQDVASETFAVVLRELHRFRWKGAGFEAWLFRIASNLVVDRFRRGGRESPGHDVVALAEDVDPVDPESRAVRREESSELMAALDLLSKDQKEVLTLRFIADMSTAETAAAMGRKENAVRQLQFRALQSMRAHSLEGVR